MSYLFCHGLFSRYYNPTIPIYGFQLEINAIIKAAFSEFLALNYRYRHIPPNHASHTVIFLAVTLFLYSEKDSKNKKRNHCH